MDDGQKQWEETKLRGVTMAYEIEDSGGDLFAWVLSLRVAAQILEDAQKKGKTVSEIRTGEKRSVDHEGDH